MSVINSALAGLNASTRKLEVGASNLVNSQTVGKPGATGAEAAYQPVDAVQITGSGGGPEIVVKERDPATSLTYSPDHALASDDGYVESPNVDVATELVNNQMAQRTYEANLKSIATWDEMQETLLDIKS